MICKKCKRTIKGKSHDTGLCSLCRSSEPCTHGKGLVEVPPEVVASRLHDMRMNDIMPEDDQPLTNNDLFMIHKCRDCNTEKVIIGRLCMCMACLDKAYLKLVTRKTE